MIDKYISPSTCCYEERQEWNLIYMILDNSKFSAASEWLLPGLHD